MPTILESTTEKTESYKELLELWREALGGEQDTDLREVVLSELSEYFKQPVEVVRQRSLHWEDESVEEWEARDRSTPEALYDFYRTQVSWIFDTMYYHAKQYYGEATPETVEIVAGLRDRLPAKLSVYDFGAGPGSSGLFFARLGWEVSLGDISTSMLDFARWRLQKHGVNATLYDTAKDELPAESFDLITAFDVMVHVPDIEETLVKLRRALKPGGYLVFNIDNLPKTRRTQWHLYAEQYPILGKIRTLGFRRHPKIIYFHVYQKLERTPLNAAMIKRLDQLRYNKYVTMIGNPTRRVVRYLNQQFKNIRAKVAKKSE
jgi:2-polyprenyl-3-methyl-5-hydroxy-6-metoxy-1,4-benzoquinol methylase